MVWKYPGLGFVPFSFILCRGIDSSLWGKDSIKLVFFLAKGIVRGAINYFILCKIPSTDVNDVLNNI